MKEWGFKLTSDMKSFRIVKYILIFGLIIGSLIFTFFTDSLWCFVMLLLAYLIFKIDYISYNKKTVYKNE